MLNKMLYNTVLSQTLSPCGKYLVAGNIYGDLAVFEYVICIKFKEVDFNIWRGL